jgi:hypothetical protein
MTIMTRKKPGPKAWLKKHERLNPKSFTISPAHEAKLDRIAKIRGLPTRSQVVQALIDEASEEIPQKSD